MDLRHLDYIIAIADQKCISRAAEQVFSTQPALSQYLRKIENSLGMPLFVRENQAMRLTRMGEIYVQAARAILETGRSTDSLLEDIRNLRKGHITLGISQERGTVVLPMVIPAFYRKYPGVRVEVLQSNTRNLEASAMQGHVDLAIFPIVKPLKDYSELDYEVLCQDEMLLVVPLSHPLSGLPAETGARRPVADLRLFKDDVFCLKNPGSHIRLASDAMFAAYGIEPEIRMEAVNIYAVHDAAVMTGSLTFIPETMTRFSKLRKDCVYYSIDASRYSTPIVAAYRRGTYLNQAALELIDLLRISMSP